MHQNRSQAGENTVLQERLWRRSALTEINKKSGVSEKEGSRLAGGQCAGRAKKFTNSKPPL
jgi:hypothetical protein